MMGILFALAALLLWSLWAFLPKLALRSLSRSSAFTFEILGGLLFGVLLLSFVQNVQFHPLGSALAVASGICNYAGVMLYLYLLGKTDVGPLATVTGLYPAVTVLLAYLFLGEQLSVTAGIGVLAALMGGVAVSWPAHGQGRTEDKSVKRDRTREPATQDRATQKRHRPLTILAIVAILFLWGLWGLLPKAAVSYIRPSDVLFHELAGGVLILVTMAWKQVSAVRTVVRKDDHTIALLAGQKFTYGRLFATAAGFCAFSGMYFYALAVNVHAASLMAPLTGMYPVGAFVLGALVLKERVTILRAVGLVTAMLAIWLLT